MGRLNSTAVAILVSVKKRLGLSDVRRWSKQAALDTEWEPRTAIIGSMVEPNSTVLEFGAGRLTLPKYLAKGCSYIPSDIVNRGKGTLVCDLNAQILPEFPAADVAVFSGVLEYVNDVPRLIAHLGKNCRSIIASYSAATGKGAVAVMRRRAGGWVNDFTDQEFIDTFGSRGYKLVETRTYDQQQKIFRFRQEDEPRR